MPRLLSGLVIGAVALAAILFLPFPALRLVACGVAILAAHEYLRVAPAIDKVIYDSKLDVLRHALGLHTAISRVQGGKLKAKKEIRIASLFKEAPPEFLRMIVVHELAHLKESDHNKAFYRLCEFMQPGYHQVEFDLRLHLTYRELIDGQ